MAAVAVASTFRDYVDVADQSTQDVEVVDRSYAELLELVTELLGYDIFASEAEGYQAMAQESLWLAESNLGAAVETLPPE